MVETIGSCKWIIQFWAVIGGLKGFGGAMLFKLVVITTIELLESKLLNNI